MAPRTTTPPTARDRQSAVGRLLYVEGRTQQEAAAILGVSQRTVNYYKARIDAEVAERLRQSAIADAVIALGRAYEPDGLCDPEDDPRPEAACRQLAALIGDGAAQGVASGLMSLWTRWALEGQGMG